MARWTVPFGAIALLVALLGLPGTARAQDGVHAKASQAPRVSITLTATLVGPVTVSVDAVDLQPGYLATVYQTLDRQQRVVQYSALDDPNAEPIRTIRPRELVAEGDR